MWEKYGEFNSAEELNKKAAELLTDGKTAEILELAKENGIDREDAEGFIDRYEFELATPMMAAEGKLKLESKELDLAGILSEWKDLLLSEATRDEKLCAAIRKKGKSLAACMAELIRYAFENKVAVSDKIVNITKVTVNGHEEKMRRPLYLGIPTQADAKRIMRKYYMEG